MVSNVKFLLENEKMKIKIPAEKFEWLKDFIEIAEEHKSKGIILDNKQGHFERLKDKSTKKESIT